MISATITNSRKYISEMYLLLGVCLYVQYMCKWVYTQLQLERHCVYRELERLNQFIRMVSKKDHILRLFYMVH